MAETLSKKQFGQLLGNALRNARIEIGLSQEKFGGNAGLGRSHYSSIERGEKAISAYNLFRILEANGITPESIFNKI